MEYRFYLYHQDVGKYTRITDPEGWDGLGRTIKRYGIDNLIGQKWHGLFYEYSAKVKFIKDGANFIQGFYELYGIEQDILVKIETRNPTTLKFEEEYVGRLDLSSYKRTTLFAECKIENTGFIQKIKNAMDVKVELTDPITITLHSKVLRRVFRQAGAGLVTQTQGPGTYYFMLGTTLYGATDTMQALYTDEISERFDYPTQAATGSPVTDKKYRFKIKEGGDYNFKYNIGYTITDNGANSRNWSVQWKLVHGTDGSYTTVNIGAVHTATGATSIGGSRSLETDIALAKGDEVYLFAEVIITGGPSSSMSFLANSNSIPSEEYFEIITADTQIEESDANVVMVDDAFSQVIESITGKANSFYSDHYGRTDSTPAYSSDGEGSLRCVTNGYQIRTIDKSIHCTLRDLITTFAGIDGIGLGIESIDGVERVRVEPITYWYQTKKMMSLSFVKDIDKEVEKDLIFNQVEAGPTLWKNEKINNLDEFNTKAEWTLPITQVKNLLDLKIPYITGGYPIEFTRREKNEPTKDSRYDDSNFVIQLKRIEGGFAPAKDEGFTTVENVISPSTSYNLLLSPARCFRRNGRLIRASLYKQASQSVVFTFGEANKTLNTQYTAEAAVLENADLIATELDDALFVPEVYTVRAKLTREQLDTLNVTDVTADNNIFQYIEFSKTDKDYKRGYVLEARPASNSNEVVMKLLKANA